MALDPARWAGVGLAQTVRALIGAMVRGYRERRGILRALTLYAHTHPDPPPKLPTYPVTVSEDRLGEEFARMLLGYLSSRG